MNKNNVVKIAKLIFCGVSTGTQYIKEDLLLKAYKEIEDNAKTVLRSEVDMTLRSLNTNLFDKISKAFKKMFNKFDDNETRKILKMNIYANAKNQKISNMKIIFDYSNNDGRLYGFLNVEKDKLGYYNIQVLKKNGWRINQGRAGIGELLQDSIKQSLEDLKINR